MTLDETTTKPQNGFHETVDPEVAAILDKTEKGRSRWYNVIRGRHIKDKSTFVAEKQDEAIKYDRAVEQKTLDQIAASSDVYRDQSNTVFFPNKDITQGYTPLDRGLVGAIEMIEKYKAGFGSSLVARINDRVGEARVNEVVKEVRAYFGDATKLLGTAVDAETHYQDQIDLKEGDLYAAWGKAQEMADCAADMRAKLEEVRAEQREAYTANDASKAKALAKDIKDLRYDIASFERDRTRYSLRVEAADNMITGKETSLQQARNVREIYEQLEMNAEHVLEMLVDWDSDRAVASPMVQAEMVEYGNRLAGILGGIYELQGSSLSVAEGTRTLAKLQGTRAKAPDLTGRITALSADQMVRGEQSYTRAADIIARRQSDLYQP